MLINSLVKINKVNMFEKWLYSTKELNDQEIILFSKINENIFFLISITRIQKYTQKKEYLYVRITFIFKRNSITKWFLPFIWVFALQLLEIYIPSIYSR